MATLKNAFEEIRLLKDQLYKENLALREEIDVNRMFEEIVGSSPALQQVLSRVAKVAPTDSSGQQLEIVALDGVPLSYHKRNRSTRKVDHIR